jgi:hypothetical protein
MNRYKPGQSFRASLTATLLGVLTDPSNLAATMGLPGGTITVGAPVRDSVGLWHCDFLIPFTIAPGIGYYRFQSTGAQVAQNALEEKRFYVEPLDF